MSACLRLRHLDCRAGAHATGLSQAHAKFLTVVNNGTYSVDAQQCQQHGLQRRPQQVNWAERVVHGNGDSRVWKLCPGAMQENDILYGARTICIILLRSQLAVLTATGPKYMLARAELTQP